MPGVELKRLRKEFSVPGGIEVAVDDVDYTADEGEFVSLVGPSGCGKTTTLRCIAGLETPTSGTVHFGDREVTYVPANKRGVSMMFQDIALYPHMTIRENIAYPLKIKHISRSERSEQAEEVADLMQIPELMDKYPGELSGGQRQRAALARTIIQDPVCFLMDEPLSDLDAKLKTEMRKEIQRIHKRMGKTTIYVTHDQEEAMTMSDQIAVMNDGRIMQSGTPDQLYKRPENEFVAQFIGSPSMNFLQATVESVKGDTITISMNGKQHTFDVDSDRDLTGSTVTVGFRPESLAFDSQDEGLTLEAEVLLTEYVGDRMLVTLEGPQGELRAATHPSLNLEEDTIRTFSVDEEQMHIFDAESGEAIRTGYSEELLV